MTHVPDYPMQKLHNYILCQEKNDTLYVYVCSLRAKGGVGGLNIFGFWFCFGTPRGGWARRSRAMRFGNVVKMQH